MRAVRLDTPAPIENSPLKLVDIPIPEPREGHILLRVAACGVCHTDLHTAEGDLELPRLPIVPGHQVVGKVERVGASTSRFVQGARVGVTWFFSSCGTCLYCRSGKENLCDAAKFTGYHADGGYADYVIVPESSAFSIPDVFSDVEATPLLCGGVIGYRALRLSEAKPGQALGLYGFGNSAHVVIQIAIKRGCRVHVFTRNKSHQELAEKLGPSG